MWAYAAIAYAAGFGIWTVSVYVAAWANGGITTGDAGFPHGRFSYLHALIFAAMFTVILIGARLRQQGRRAIFWVLGLAALLAGVFLVAGTSA